LFASENPRYGLQPPSGAAPGPVALAVQGCGDTPQCGTFCTQCTNGCHSSLLCRIRFDPASVGRQSIAELNIPDSLALAPFMAERFARLFPNGFSFSSAHRSHDRNHPSPSRRRHVQRFGNGDQGRVPFVKQLHEIPAASPSHRLPRPYAIRARQIQMLK
jgi:hypothetical protein